MLKVLKLLLEILERINRNNLSKDENDNIIWGYSLDDSSNEVINKIRKKYNHI